jgi:FkbH-like protein
MELGAVAAPEAPPARETVRALIGEQRYDDAWRTLRPALLDGADASAWSLARNLLKVGMRAGWKPPAARQIRLGVLSGYETAELVAHLELACWALRIDATLYAAPFGQLEQEVLDARSGLNEFEPTHVLVAPSTADLDLPQLADDPASVLDVEEARWRRLWEGLSASVGARVVQHTFVAPDSTALGHLALRLPGSRLSLVRELNARLARAAGTTVLLVDCERLASSIGKQTWLDPRLWHQMRQPFSFAALPVLARATAAVLAGDLGLGARCLVVDLDNTLWGGIVGEEGPDGVVVGDGPDGEAYAAFQDYLLELARRGVLLAVASKNDAAAARSPFLQNPRMRLTLDDFAVFVADWRRKPEQLAEIAEQLGLGLDSLVFADDNPAECAEVAAALPAVDTVPLAVPPSELTRTLAASLRFEAANLTSEDVARQRSYAARAQAQALQTEAVSLEDFWRSLEMRGRVADVDASSLERAAQLTQKTNQFNLTLERRTVEEVRRLVDEPTAICKTLELDDRFAQHGTVGVAFAVPAGDAADTLVLDTLLLSCRVIGRTAEVHLLSHLCRAALDAGFTRLRGAYVEGPRNALVADLLPRLGFVPVEGDPQRWEYDIGANGPPVSHYIADAG